MARSLAAVSSRIGPDFGRAVRMLRDVEGHVIVTGLGKSGLIGRKIASTLASTGTPSFFVHSGEAFHGDLGMITERDAVILISYSGETKEVVQLLPHLRRRGIPTVSLAGNPSSTLARGADIALDVGVDREVCPNNLAPTSSTLTTLAMGDALAVSLIRLRGFEAADFARFHPGGSLGRRLARVDEAMSRDLLPAIQSDASARDCTLALARSRVPMVLVLEGRRLRGVIGEAELRDALDASDGLNAPVASFMKADPPVIAADALVVDAEALMERAGLPALVVVDDDGQVCGMLLHRS
ncbi:MAG: KpsF/GutQ family sugar-phosphate isomerase [Sandaracinus sp.]|nr:KpsF/GutQ family sugar-phosphate isomerase [Myxococcales bacterium]MAT25621.1 KpsF/GutQ family sugar-phosphate isomerase [Sandaracinus sp.]MBJ73852.1 KpsF/GutQ family sugar-phosphate isomerase [Sandaracinus sp.]